MAIAAARSGSTATLLRSSGCHAADHVGDDGVGSLGPRVVRCHDDAVGQLGGDGAHLRPLGVVAVAAAAEHDDDPARGDAGGRRR